MNGEKDVKSEIKPENKAAEITLTDGRKAVIRRGKGRDLFEAMRLSSSPEEIPKLLLARLLLIDGKPITENELEELDLADTMNLMTLFMELYPFLPRLKR